MRRRIKRKTKFLRLLFNHFGFLSHSLFRFLFVFRLSFATLPVVVAITVILVSFAGNIWVACVRDSVCASVFVIKSLLNNYW